jgi:hypothetical protein
VTAPLDRIGEDWQGRDLFLLELQSWEDWPRDLELPSEHFCLLVAGNGRGVDPAAIAAFASGALAAGCVYACAWGPGCKIVHDTFDAKASEIETEGFVIMTTWHEDEGLEEGLTFLGRDALPDDHWVGTRFLTIIGFRLAAPLSLLWSVMNDGLPRCAASYERPARQATAA